MLAVGILWRVLNHLPDLVPASLVFFLLVIKLEGGLAVRRAVDDARSAAIKRFAGEV